MKIFFLLLALFTSASADTVCSLISGDLPSECTCTDGANYEASVACTVNFVDLDTIGFDLTLQPCAQPASFSGVVTESKLNSPSTFCRTPFQIERTALHSYGSDPHSC